MNKIKIANELVKLSKHILCAEKALVDDDLVKSCHRLIKYNDGYFKSDKQKRFFVEKIKRGKEKTSGYNLKSDDVGIILGTFSKKTRISGRWVFIIDEEGVRKKTWEWYKLQRGKSKEEVDREFRNMSFRDRERNWGLQNEMMQDFWVYGGRKVKWKRKDR